MVDIVSTTGEAVGFVDDDDDNDDGSVVLDVAAVPVWCVRGRKR